MVFEVFRVGAWALIGAAVFSLIFGSALVIGADSNALLAAVTDNPTRWLEWPSIYGAMAGASWGIVTTDKG